MRQAARKYGELEVLDVVHGGDGAPQRRTRHTRDASLDWAEAVLPQVRRQERRGEAFGLRFEWPKPEAPPPDRADPTAPEPEPPEHVYVIAPAEQSLVRIRLERTESGPKGVGFEIRAREGSLSPSLRKMGLDWLVKEVDRILAEDYAMGRILGSTWRRQVARPGRAGRPDVFYAAHAERYVAALEVAPDRPIKHLIQAAKNEGRWETEGQWRAWLNRARMRDLLTDAPPGKAGGELTPRATALLAIESKGRGKR